MAQRKFPPLKVGAKNRIHIFYKQPHFRVEPRIAIKIPKMRLEVAMKLLSISGIEAKVAKFFDNFRLKCMKLLIKNV